jgi:hypothetical protein
VREWLCYAHSFVTNFDKVWTFRKVRQP